MGDVDRLDCERTDSERLAWLHDGNVDIFDNTVPCPLRGQHGSGEWGRIDRLVKHRPQIKHGAIMVFVAVGQDKGQHVVSVFFEELRIGHDQLNARQVRPAKADAAIHHDPFARPLRTKAVGGHVHADFANAAKRHEDEFIPLVLSHGSLCPICRRDA